jgi:threonine dehydratase
VAARSSFRGAYNTISALSEEERRAASSVFLRQSRAGSGAVARLFGVPAVIIMPEDAPERRSAPRGAGAEVLPTTAIAKTAGDRRAATQPAGMSLVPPFDHPEVIAGQATAAPAPEEVPDPTPCGALQRWRPAVRSAIAGQTLRAGLRVFGVRPGRWMTCGGALRRAPGGIGSARRRDSLQPPPGPADLPDPAAARCVVTVNDPELVECLRFLLERMKVLVEPSGGGRRGGGAARPPAAEAAGGGPVRQERRFKGPREFWEEYAGLTAVMLSRSEWWARPAFFGAQICSM